MTNAEKELRIDFGLTFGPQPGMNVLTYLANRYHMFASRIPADALQLAYEEGQRSVVLDIIEKSSMQTFDERKKQILEELKHGR